MIKILMIEDDFELADAVHSFIKNKQAREQGEL